MAEGVEIKGIFHASSQPLREVIAKSIHKLRAQRCKLEQAVFRLMERDKKLSETCVNALRNDDKDKATVWATEIVEVRKLIKSLRHAELAIERIITRLETLKELSDVVSDLKSALKVLRSVSKELFEVLPEISSELSKINDVIDETLCSTRIIVDASVIPINEVTLNGKGVLKEVSDLLQQRVSERLPEPPTLETKELEEMVALTAVCSQAISREPVRSFQLKEDLRALEGGRSRDGA